MSLMKLFHRHSDAEGMSALQKQGEKLAHTAEAIPTNKDSVIPVMALGILRGMAQLMASEDPKDRKDAEQWLRCMWDALDLTVFRTAAECKDCKKHMTVMIMASYMALDCYFTTLGSIDKGIGRLEQKLIKEKKLAPENLEQLKELGKEYARFMALVTELGGGIMI